MNSEQIDKAAAQRANVLIQLAGEANHEHSWQLTEKGYIRSWTTEIEDDGTIKAYYGGSEDWSENGDGYLYLECLQCGATQAVNEPNKVDWQ